MIRGDEHILSYICMPQASVCSQSGTGIHLAKTSTGLPGVPLSNSAVEEETQIGLILNVENVKISPFADFVRLLCRYLRNLNVFVYLFVCLFSNLNLSGSCPVGSLFTNKRSENDKIHTFALHADFVPDVTCIISSSHLSLS